MNENLQQNSKRLCAPQQNQFEKADWLRVFSETKNEYEQKRKALAAEAESTKTPEQSNTVNSQDEKKESNELAELDVLRTAVENQIRGLTKLDATMIKPEEADRLRSSLQAQLDDINEKMKKAAQKKGVHGALIEEELAQCTRHRRSQVVPTEITRLVEQNDEVRRQSLKCRQDQEQREPTTPTGSTPRQTPSQRIRRVPPSAPPPPPPTPRE